MITQDPKKIVITAAVNGPFTMREKRPGIPWDGQPQRPLHPGGDRRPEQKDCYDAGRRDRAHAHPPPRRHERATRPSCSARATG